MTLKKKMETGGEMSVLKQWDLSEIQWIFKPCTGKQE